MAVVLTVVLSILSHSVTDIKLSSKDEESQRAFSAAEAGIEQVLITGSDASGPIGDANFTASVTGYGSGTKTLVYPSALYAGETATIWFVSHAADGSLTCTGWPCFKSPNNDSIKVCWGNEGTNANSAVTPALEISVVYAKNPGNYNQIQIGRAAYDPYTGRPGGNNFASPVGSGCQIGTTNFAFYKTFQFGGNGADQLSIPNSSYRFENGLQFIRYRLFYNNVAHLVGIDVTGGANTVLPSQGSLITSSGTAAAGESNRKIEVYQSFGEVPGVFSSTVFSSGGIVK